MDWRVYSDTAEAEAAAAACIADRLKEAARVRGRASLAISGGRSPWGMFTQLAGLDVDWNTVHIFQVDERIVALGAPERNWSHYLETPLASLIPVDNAHPMPVEYEDPEIATGKYSATLSQWAGVPPRLDVVHLGIGADGHTASLFEHDSLLQDRRHWVGVSREYEGHRRLSLTLPVLNGAGTIVWFAIGEKRRAILARLRSGDPQIPAGHVSRERSIVFTDQVTL